MTGQEPTWGDRINNLVRRHPVIVILILAAVVLSSSITIWQTADAVWEYYEEEYRWRNREYAKIEELNAGISVARVEELLGPPLFIYGSADGTLTERSYQERDYWVQIVHDDVGTVKMLAVTSCDLKFTPTIRNVVGSVTLNRDTFASVGDPWRLRYQIMAGSAGTYYDEYGPGNPYLYKTYFYGANDACAISFPIGPLNDFVSSQPNGGQPYPFDEQSSPLWQFRTQAVVNTYAETDVGTDPEPILKEFQIGVAYFRTRVVDLPDFEPPRSSR